MGVTASDIEGLAAGGAEAYERLIRDGVPKRVRYVKTWVEHKAGAWIPALLESAPVG
jgi:hypothetical protein